MGGWRKFYLPEIHDLYPGMAPGADALAALFPAAARPHIAWSIVPNWQGARPLDADPAASGVLAALPGDKVLHGWTHSLGPRFYDWLVYGHDNRSEFRTLSRAEAEDRLTRGRALLHRALGTAPGWFCAPRWQLSAGGAQALRALGFQGYLGRDRIVVHDGPEIVMPALNFDEGERAPVQALARAARRPLIRRLLRDQTPFRLVVHPGDVTHPATLAQLREVAATLQRDGWQPLPLEAVIARARAANPAGGMT